MEEGSGRKQQGGMEVYTFLDVETGEIICVEMTHGQFLAWLDEWVKDLDLGDLEESGESEDQEAEMAYPDECPCGCDWSGCTAPDCAEFPSVERCHHCGTVVSSPVYSPKHEETTKLAAFCRVCHGRLAASWEREYNAMACCKGDGDDGRDV